ncbi:zinc metalloprotease [Planococcus kocurii]|uniref:Zinc metalloprotease n=1 Tax=Planococcus kocurii TaxID=1374 RepID=A0ABM5WSH4_9BACL|nr:SprT family zinc-dependent metalloprotease [Planococcus kocurii]ALS77210.1 zinc metalloprotease [Planococcus kocurii]
MPKLVYGTTTIDYTLEYLEKKTDISVTVEWLDGVNVMAPTGITEETLQHALYKKAPWILRKWNELSEINGNVPVKEFCSGEKFAYLGRQYRLKVIKGTEVAAPSLHYSQGKFIAKVSSSLSPLEKRDLMNKQFKQWYIKNGEKKVKERAEIYSSKMLVKPSKIALKEQKMRWGTCTPTDAIYLNWRLVMAPIAIIDYVLVHELAHIKHPNHSQEFWRFVASILPDYEQRKEWLRVNGPLLTL